MFIFFSLFQRFYIYLASHKPASLPTIERKSHYFSFLLCLGQFWPGLDMGRTGLSKKFFLPRDFEWEGSFTMEHKDQLSKDSSPCNKVQIRPIIYHPTRD